MNINPYPPKFFDKKPHKLEDPEERERVQARADSLRRQMIEILDEHTVDVLIRYVNGPGDGSDMTLAMDFNVDRSTTFRRRKAAYAKIRRHFCF